MQHDWDKYFDTETEYWKKIQEIYQENEEYPKEVVSGRNLHHKFLRSFSKLEGTEIDNDPDNLVSLSEGDHFLVHYYLWKCTKQGFRRQTGLTVRFMYKKAAKYLTDDIAELIAKEWTCKGSNIGYHHSEETKAKLREEKLGDKNPAKRDDVKEKIRKTLTGRKNPEHSKRMKGREPPNKGKKASEETKAKLRKAWEHRERHHTTSEETKRKISEAKLNGHSTKGKHWFTDGVKDIMAFECPEGFIPGRTNS